ncbi:hypothetical protein T4B_12810 [Trichinella pseudospiralis]|uniref:Uncharacterized protein n=1 Tax=Trichinella pseudospiralis TaxID=6337 RepID=A0A0V1GKK5_TRIPS|nr:hypothetical protein T4B_12810 [Trichinella pseudospiralis]
MKPRHSDSYCNSCFTGISNAVEEVCTAWCAVSDINANRGIRRVPSSYAELC